VRRENDRLSWMRGRKIEREGGRCCNTSLLRKVKRGRRGGRKAEEGWGSIGVGRRRAGNNQVRGRRGLMRFIMSRSMEEEEGSEER
jgi:hypothetical protein